MGLTNATRLALTEHLAGITPWTAPATYYLGIATNFPGVTDADNATGFTEVSGGGYARKAITWPDVVESGCAGALDGSAAIEFDEQTADWGVNIPNSAPYGSLLIFDASSGGNLIAWSRTYNTAYSSGGIGYIVNVSLVISMSGWVPSICASMLKHFTGELTYTPPTWYLGVASFPDLCAETYTDTGSARAAVSWETDPDFSLQVTNDADLSIGQSAMGGLVLALFDASSAGNLAKTTTIPAGVQTSIDFGASVDVYKAHVLGLRVT